MFSNPIVALARIGYAARGVIYLMVGALAAAAAVGAGKRPSGAGDAFQTLFSQRFGAMLVVAITFGLLCFALWRLAQSIFDADHHGRSKKAMLIRIALFVSSLMYVSMSGSAVALLLGYRTRSGDQTAHDWTSYFVTFPFGIVVVGFIGFCLVCAAAVFIGKAWKGDVTKRLKPDTTAWIEPIGRAGYLARGLVFAIAGGGLCVAAFQADPGQARGLGESLQVLQRQPFGWALFGATALGLAAFGVFQLLVAAYRTVEAPRA